MSGRLRGEAGVSILEVVAAMLLVALAVFAVVREITASEATTGRASNLQVAVATADASLERLRSLPYDRVALAGPAEPLPGDALGAAVEARLGSDGGEPTYRVPDGGAEALVEEDPASPVPSFERSVATVAGTPVRLRVYRFVSWRDEECPVADPGRLEQALAELRDPLAATAGSLEALLGEEGRLSGALRDGDTLLGGPLGGPLLAPLLTAVGGAVQTGLVPLDALLRPQLSPVQGALTAVDALLDPVTGKLRDSVDLCDLPAEAVPSLEALEAARVALAALDPLLQAAAPTVEAAAEVLHALAGLSPAELVGALAQAPALTARTTELLGHVAALGTALGDLQDARGADATLAGLAGEVESSLAALSAFLDAPDTQRNSKRISVAVVVEGGLGPRRPVWASTVVTDPDEGLL